MTDREKLIELIGNKQTFGSVDRRTPGVVWRYEITNEKLADHLLNNGVTFATDTKVGDKWTPTEPLTNCQQWIPVTDRLPEHDTDVLCWYEYFRYGNYNRMYQTCGIGYCINGNWGGEVARGTKCRVLAWMPLPEPPKEE